MFRHHFEDEFMRILNITYILEVLFYYQVCQQTQSDQFSQVTRYFLILKM